MTVKTKTVVLLTWVHASECYEHCTKGEWWSVSLLCTPGQSTRNCSHTLIHRVHRDGIWLPAVAPKEKKRVRLGAQSHWLTSWSRQQSWRGEESQRWFGLFEIHGESHLPSAARQLGLFWWQRSSSVHTMLRNCYHSTPSDTQKQSPTGVDCFYCPHIINYQLISGSWATCTISATWKLVDVNPTPSAA